MRKIFISLIAVMTAVSCTDKNPFLSEWDTPYGIPDFGESIKAQAKKHRLLNKPIATT